MNKFNNNQIDTDEVHLLDYLIILAKYSRMIIFTSFAVMILIFLLLFAFPNKYKSTVRILPPQQNMTLSAQLLNALGSGTPGAQQKGTVTGMASGLLGLKSPTDLYVDMLTGDTVFDRIIERFKLRQLYGEKYIESTRKTLGQKATVTARNGLITIEVTDKSPKRAAEMANAFSEELDNLLRKVALKEAGDRLAFLEKERGLANQNMVKAENVLRGFSEQKNVIQIDTQTRGVLEYIARLRAEIDSKEVQAQVLRQQATPFNYDVVRLETEINGLKDKLSTSEKQYDQALGGDVRLTTAKVPGLGLEYMRLYREVKFQEALYLLYTKMVELARLDMVKDFPVIQVVDKAIPPEKDSNKRLTAAVLTGVVTGFIMIFLSFFIENWQTTAHTAAESERREELKKYLRPWLSNARRLFPFLKSKKS